MQHLSRPWPPLEDLDRIVTKASGLFIFALTVVKFVGDRMHDPVHRLRALLEDKTSRDTAYADLDALYLDAISVFPDADTVRLVLGIVYCMPVPVPVAALHKLLDRPDVDARIVVPALASVLLSSENGEQPIQFYHASFRDFLVSPQRSRRYYVHPIVYHRLMAQLCFRTMVKSLKRNVCGIEDPSQFNRDIQDLQERRQAAYDEALVYACRYWAHHLTQLPSKGGVYEGLLDAMQEFCSTALLYWIEVFSLFNDMENAVVKLRSGVTWIKSLGDVPKDTATLLEDAQRLVLLYREPISQCALHVYHAAISLAPTSSALYRTYKHEAGTSFTITHNQDDEWLPYQYAIDIGSINSVAFSPSGDVVATASEKQGVQLWNVVTGGNVASLGDRSASSLLVRFSSDGGFVAAAFSNGMVAVWDPSVGREHLNDADPHSDKITCLEFSPDNALLASGARDHTLQLWSLDTAQRLHKLVAHEGPVTSLAFTSDSQRLCSGSEDNLLIVWDAKSGKVVRGMMGHRGAINALCISKDGNMIATASQDKSVKLWDARSGTCTRTLAKGHQKTLRSVHFFDDDKRFVSASPETILSSSVSTRRLSSDVALWDLGKNIAVGNEQCSGLAIQDPWPGPTLIRTEETGRIRL
ncbi:WD40 repeat-like protein [Gyrodon lividus]|nr:WD40 repeat-like protein [Gyrodon lividus]